MAWRRDTVGCGTTSSHWSAARPMHMPWDWPTSFSIDTSNVCLRPAESGPSKRSVICGTMRVVVPGDTSLRLTHVEHLYRSADILQLVLAAVVEDVLDTQLDEVAHRARHGDAAGLGQGLDARGQVHAVAEDVLVLVVDDDFAQMHADAEQHALLLAQRVVEAGHPLLDVDRGGDRRHGRAELGQHGVARRADQAATADVDGRAPDLDLGRLEMTEGACLRAFHHPGESGEVGMDDGG